MATPHRPMLFAIVDFLLSFPLPLPPPPCAGGCCVATLGINSDRAIGGLCAGSEFFPCCIPRSAIDHPECRIVAQRRWESWTYWADGGGSVCGGDSARKP